MKKLLILPVFLLAGIVLFWFLGTAPEPLEDTNGPDNYNLQSISDSMIIKSLMVCRL